MPDGDAKYWLNSVIQKVFKLGAYLKHPDGIALQDEILKKDLYELEKQLEEKGNG